MRKRGFQTVLNEEKVFPRRGNTFFFTTAVKEKRKRLKIITKIRQNS